MRLLIVLIVVLSILSGTKSKDKMYVDTNNTAQEYPHLDYNKDKTLDIFDYEYCFSENLCIDDIQIEHFNKNAYRMIITTKTKRLFSIKQLL